MSAPTPEAMERRRVAAQARVRKAAEALVRAEAELDRAAQALAQVQGATLACDGVRELRDSAGPIRARLMERLRGPADFLLDHDPAESSR